MGESLMAKGKPFQFDSYGGLDKYIEIHGPDLNLRVDYDDVNHTMVDKGVRQMVDILNEHWIEIPYEQEPDEFDDEHE
jgi:hypothetical protein